jgi:protein-tyrosine phosphatase
MGSARKITRASGPGSTRGIASEIRLGICGGRLGLADVIGCQDRPHDMIPLLPATGRIDLHSHLLPDVDDGCASIEQSLACIEELQAHGYVGSVCTPHVWGELFPDNTPARIGRWVDRLRDRLLQDGVHYHLWAGGEVRLFDGVVSWMKVHGVPTLAGSNCVLTDFWEERWPAHVDRTFAWLLDEGYTPVLAHPERLPCPDDLIERLDELAAMGVLLQGNFKPVTGDEGLGPMTIARRLLDEDRYVFMALDMHRPDSLASRFEGLRLLERELGPARVSRYTESAPRDLIVGFTVHAAA